MGTTASKKYPASSIVFNMVCVMPPVQTPRWICSACHCGAEEKSFCKLSCSADPDFNQFMIASDKAQQEIVAPDYSLIIPTIMDIPIQESKDIVKKIIVPEDFKCVFDDAAFSDEFAFMAKPKPNFTMDLD
jgi:hypothetical protein